MDNIVSGLFNAMFQCRCRSCSIIFPYLCNGRPLSDGFQCKAFLVWQVYRLRGRVSVYLSGDAICHFLPDSLIADAFTVISPRAAAGLLKATLPCTAGRSDSSLNNFRNALPRIELRLHRPKCIPPSTKMYPYPAVVLAGFDLWEAYLTVLTFSIESC